VAKLKRLVVPAALLLAAYWAVWGGEYSIIEVRRARRDRELEAAELERVRHEVDSLGLLIDSLDSDPAVLERLAREKYGMIKEGETLYRFAEPRDSGAAAPDTVR
jgi:cell division protein FtsB